MPKDPRRKPKPEPNRAIWLVGGLLVALLVLFAIQGVLRGGGEAVGIDAAAPGGSGATPRPQDGAN